MNAWMVCSLTVFCLFVVVVVVDLGNDDSFLMNLPSVALDQCVVDNHSAHGICVYV